MAPTVIAAPALLLDGRITGPGALAVEAGRIVALRDDPQAAADVRLTEGVLTPGLIDLQNNGAFGVDFAAASEADWPDVLGALAGSGVTALTPTIITAPLAAIRLRIAAVAKAAAAAAGRGTVEARILGVHLEGPFLAEARQGAHRAEWMCDADGPLLDALLGDRATREMLRIVTLAPERPHALKAIARLAAGGVLVSLGHSDATAEQAFAARAAGARMVTHLFNAMRPFAHRDPGLAGVALTDPGLFVGLIIDGLHVDPIACRLAFRAAGERLVGVSDSIAVAGLAAGSEISFGGAPVRAGPDGLGRRPDGTIAGAGIVLDEGVRRMIRAGIEPEAVLRAVTETPARAIARSDLGRLVPGAHADLVWWDEDWRPRRVWIAGREVASEKPRQGLRPSGASPNH